MLIPKNKLGIFRFSISALLLVISVFTFHSNAQAKSKEKVAEEYHLKGYEAQQDGDLREALSFYNKAIELGFKNARLFNDMGILYEQVNSYARAERFYLRAIQIDKTYLPSYSNLAYLYKENDLPDKAALYFKLRYELGDEGDLWAEQAKEELLSIRPDYARWVATLQSKKLAEETVLYKKQQAREMQEAFNRRVERSEQHYRAGEQLLASGQHQAAMREFNKALALVPENPKVLNARKRAKLEEVKNNIKKRSEQAILSLESGDSASAEEEIRKILSTIPNEP